MEEWNEEYKSMTTKPDVVYPENLRHQAEIMEQDLHDLAAMITTLRGKLEPLLRRVKESVPEERVVDNPERSPMFCAHEANRRAILDATADLDEIYRGLEI